MLLKRNKTFALIINREVSEPSGLFGLISDNAKSFFSDTHFRNTMTRFCIKDKTNRVKMANGKNIV